MNDIDAVLRELGDVARTAPAPRIDVQHRVLGTIAARGPVTWNDWVPLAVGGVAVATAAVVAITFMPTWNMMFEPWVGYFPK